MAGRKPAAEGVSLDQRFASYVELACNIDNLLWSNQATLLGITVLGWGAIAVTLENHLRFAPLSHGQTLAAILIVTACLYAITLVAKMRMRFWHLQVEAELSDMEGDGYFRKRQEPKPWYLSAPRWSIGLFSIIAAIMAIFAFIVLMFPSILGDDMKPISPAHAEAEDGVVARHETMENGERRFRLMTADGNGYILTRTSEGGWQQSHSHRHVVETYIVEKGWMLFAAPGPKKGAPPQVTQLGRGETITSAVGQVHNVYLAPGSEIHTVKRGSREGERDWEPAPHFDVATLAIPVGDYAPR